MNNDNKDTRRLWTHIPKSLYRQLQELQAEARPRVNFTQFTIWILQLGIEAYKKEQRK